MLPCDRLICAFIRPICIGDSFTDWPLHVTILPWFRVSDTTDRLILGLTRALLPISAFTSVVEAEVLVGPRKNRLALVIREPTTFHDIERRVRIYFHKKRAWIVDETTKKQWSFRPHVTIQKTDRMYEGENFKTDRLYIVEQKGTYKVVKGEIPFVK